MKRYLKLIFHFFKLSLARAINYKSDFIIWSLVSIGWTILTIIFYEIIFLNTDSIGGWSKPQVILIQGLHFILEFFLWGVLWENMREIPTKINTGAMDLELTKPVNHQFLLSFKNISFDNINNLILGIATVIYAVKTGDMTVTLAGFLAGLISLIIASVYIYAGWFMTMCVAFWFDRFDNLHFLFPSLRHFWKIPQPFYTGFLRIVVTYIIPVGLIATVPAQFIFNQPRWDWLAILSFFAVATLYASHKFFTVAVRHYGSASS